MTPKLRKKRPRKKKKEYVHGLYVLVPVRDFHLTFIIKALRNLAKEYSSKKMIAQAKYCESLAEMFGKALAQLVEKTKIYKHYLIHDTLYKNPPVQFKTPVYFEIYLDPDYKKRK